VRATGATAAAALLLPGLNATLLHERHKTSPDDVGCSTEHPKPALWTPCLQKQQVWPYPPTGREVLHVQHSDCGTAAVGGGLTIGLQKAERCSNEMCG
jgi:hypothetical protein